MIGENANRMTDFLVGASVAFGRSSDPHFHEKIGEAVTELHDYIASLEAENASLRERLAAHEVGEPPKENEVVLVATESKSGQSWVIVDYDGEYFYCNGKSWNVKQITFKRNCPPEAPKEEE